MLNHEFGIMPRAPKPTSRFDAYTPEKYAPIVEIYDDTLELLDSDMHGADGVTTPGLCRIPCYWHTPECLENSLAWCGITLIPPESAEQMVTLIEAFLQGPEAEEKMAAVAAEYHKFTGKTTEPRMELKRLAEHLRGAVGRGKWVIHYGL